MAWLVATMFPETGSLMVTASLVGFLPTPVEPDHHLPYGALAKAGDWDRRKGQGVTVLCGLIIGFVA